MGKLRIGQVARAAGVNIETIRYYERCGLLSDPGRRESGYRAYPPEVVERVQFIKRAQRKKLATSPPVASKFDINGDIE